MRFAFFLHITVNLPLGGLVLAGILFFFKSPALDFLPVTNDQEIEHDQDPIVPDTTTAATMTNQPPLPLRWTTVRTAEFTIDSELSITGAPPSLTDIITLLVS